MKNRIEELINKHPERKFQGNDSKKRMSLFGDMSSMAIGKGLGHSLGGMPAMMCKKSKFGYGNFLRQRGGG
jgi:hypothetical protein